MSGRGRSTTPKPLTPSPRRESGDRDISMSPARHATPLPVIVVHGLTKNVMRAHLEEIFGEYGKVTGLDLPLFKVSGLNQGKAAIEFDRVAAADDAVRYMNGGVLDGNILKVELSRHPLPPPREPSPPRPPARRRSFSRSPPRDGGFGDRSPPPRRPSFGGRRRSPPAWRRSPSPRGGGGDGFRRPPPAYGPNARGPGNRYGGPGGYGPSGGGNRFRSRSPPPRRDMRGGGPIRRGSPDYVRGGRSRSPRRRRSYTPSRSRSRSPVARRRSPSYSRSRSRSRSFSPRPRSVSRSRSPLPRRDRSASLDGRSSRSNSPRA